MSAFPLVAAHLLDCNRITWDPRAEDVAVLRAAVRRARWHRWGFRIAVPLRRQGEAPDGSPKLAVAETAP